MDELAMIFLQIRAHSLHLLLMIPVLDTSATSPKKFSRRPPVNSSQIHNTNSDRKRDPSTNNTPPRKQVHPWTCIRLTAYV